MESLPYKQRVFRRFVYVAHPSHNDYSTDEGRSAELLPTLTLEIASVSEKSAEIEAAALSTPESSCRLGMEASIDLLIPDR